MLLVLLIHESLHNNPRHGKKKLKKESENRRKSFNLIPSPPQERKLLLPLRSKMGKSHGGKQNKLPSLFQWMCCLAFAKAEREESEDGKGCEGCGKMEKVFLIEKLWLPQQQQSEASKKRKKTCTRSITALFPSAPHIAIYFWILYHLELQKRSELICVKLNSHMAHFSLLLVSDLVHLRFTGTSPRSCARSITSSSPVSCQRTEFDRTTTTSFSKLINGSFGGNFYWYLRVQLDFNWHWYAFEGTERGRSG